MTKMRIFYCLLTFIISVRAPDPNEGDNFAMDLAGAFLNALFPEEDKPHPAQLAQSDPIYYPEQQAVQSFPQTQQQGSILSASPLFSPLTNPAAQQGLYNPGIVGRTDLPASYVYPFAQQGAIVAPDGQSGTPYYLGPQGLNRLSPAQNQAVLAQQQNLDVQSAQQAYDLQQALQAQQLFGFGGQLQGQQQAFGSQPSLQGQQQAFGSQPSLQNQQQAFGSQPSLQNQQQAFGGQPTLQGQQQFGGLVFPSQGRIPDLPQARSPFVQAQPNFPPYEFEGTGADRVHQLAVAQNPGFAQQNVALTEFSQTLPQQGIQGPSTAIDPSDVWLYHYIHSKYPNLAYQLPFEFGAGPELEPERPSSSPVNGNAFVQKNHQSAPPSLPDPVVLGQSLTVLPNQPQTPDVNKRVPVAPRPIYVEPGKALYSRQCPQCVAFDIKKFVGPWTQIYGNPGALRTIYTTLISLQNLKLAHSTITTGQLQPVQPSCVGLQVGRKKKGAVRSALNLFFRDDTNARELHELTGALEQNVTQNGDTLALRLPSLNLPMCLVKAGPTGSTLYGYMVLTETTGVNRCSSYHIFARRSKTFFRDDNAEIAKFLQKEVADRRTLPVSVLPFPQLCEITPKGRLRSLLNRTPPRTS